MVSMLTSSVVNHGFKPCLGQTKDYKIVITPLKALTNLSLTSQHHGHYTRVVQRLYDLVDKGSANIKLQATTHTLDNYGQSCFVRSDFLKMKCVCKTQMMPPPDHKKL
jgi:hypothetical protein